MHILYLEDSDVKIAELEKCVTSSGHTLVACRTISSAITALEEHSFDFVLIGIHLQSENAFDLVRFIREHPRLTNLPVILLDSYQTRIAKAVTDSLQVVCRMMDAHYLAMEGFNSKQLIEQIEQLMEEHTAKSKAVL
ncbi:MAG: hypothetical protein C0507_16945 [Cyanobacteria bacterium PR.3.49]|jgi:CheY-like chemotaxis protein|nr:hypothetical protein [Cyanobacteria bacterium PR.3.49]